MIREERLPSVTTDLVADMDKNIKQHHSFYTVSCVILFPTSYSGIVFSSNHKTCKRVLMCC